MTKRSIWRVLLVLWVALAPNAATAQTRVENPGDPYVHKAVGVEFPLQIEKYVRTGVVEYDQDGRDASIGYTYEGMPTEFSLYVYPSRGETCIGQFASANEAIRQRVGSAPTEQDPEHSFPAFANLEQYQARYDIAAASYGYEHPDMVSYLWVGCTPGDQWIVKYRGSFPLELEPTAEALAEELFASIDWTPLIPAQ